MPDQLVEVCSESAGAPFEPGKRMVLSPRWRSPLSLAIKRGLDVVGSATLLLLLSPVFLLLAIAVKVGSAGPVFYRWKVVGRGGRPFTGYKFRSMVACGEGNHNKAPRLTRVGQIISQTGIDELPQFLNVLRGEMSIVEMFRASRKGNPVT